MSKRELYEKVRADELRVGDVILDLRDGAIDSYEIDTELVKIAKKLSKSSYPMKLRRIPDADDPMVLRLALEIASIERSDLDYTACTPPECLGDEIAKRVDTWIDQAIRELKIERSDD